MPFQQWLVSGVPGLCRIRHLSSSLNKILHRARANPEDKKLWLSIPQNSLHLHTLPTQAIDAQAVANSLWLTLHTHFLWLPLLLFTEKQFFCRVQNSSFSNPHEQHCLPNKRLHSVIFLKYFLSFSNEGERTCFWAMCFVFLVTHRHASMSQQGCPWLCCSQHQTQLAFQLYPQSKDMWNSAGTPSALYLMKRIMSY